MKREFIIMIHVRNLPSSIKYLQVKDIEKFKLNSAKKIRICQNKDESLLSAASRTVEKMQIPVKCYFSYIKALLLSQIPSCKKIAGSKSITHTRKLPNNAKHLIMIDTDSSDIMKSVAKKQMQTWLKKDDELEKNTKLTERQKLIWLIDISSRLNSSNRILDKKDIWKIKSDTTERLSELPDDDSWCQIRY